MGGFVEKVERRPGPRTKDLYQILKDKQIQIRAKMRNCNL